VGEVGEVHWAAEVQFASMDARDAAQVGGVGLQLQFGLPHEQRHTVSTSSVMYATHFPLFRSSSVTVRGDPNTPTPDSSTLITHATAGRAPLT
jgi:hypothetical protein